MLESFHVEWGVFLHVLISLGLGALVGLERQTQQSHEGKERSGARTFALAALLGTVAALVHELGFAFTLVLGIGFFVLVVAHYVVNSHMRDRALGITTETASFVVFGLGALVPTRPLLAASLAVIVTLVLSQKKWIHRSVDKLSREELYATIKLLIVSVVFLPLLPSEPIDPWGIYEPQSIWLLVVLISGISFVGYFAMQWLGSRRGIALTGLLGGLASSTAVTLAMSAKVKQMDSSGVRAAAAFAIVSANAVMLIRVIVEVAAVSPTLLPTVAPAVAVLFVGAALGSGALWWRARSVSDDDPVADVDIEVGEPEEDDEAVEPDQKGEAVEPAEIGFENPFRLGPAVKFAAVFLVIIGLVHAARELWGDQGIFIAAVVGGLADSDATVLTASKLFEDGQIEAETAMRAIVLAALSNSVVKAGLSGVLGHWRLGVGVLVAMVPLFVAAAVTWWVM